MRHLTTRHQPTPNSAQAKLLKRLTGRFYTPADIGLHLAKDVARRAIPGEGSTKTHVRVVDPFCGDGRLVKWLLSEVPADRRTSEMRWDIHVWDNDEAAIKKARSEIRAVINERSLNATVSARTKNSFTEAQNHLQSFDIVITNPPWERLKPDSREINDLPAETIDRHMQWLRAQSKLLKNLYPWSAPARGYGGWNVNLARCGVELSLRLLAPHGWCGLVTPASLFADQISSPLRQWMFRRFSFGSIAYYPAETKLFKNVDQPTATFVAQSTPPHAVTQVRVFDRSLKPEDFKIDTSLATEQTGYTLPIHGPLACLRLLERCSELPRFSSLEGDSGTRLWAGRELDETRHKHLLQDKGERPFLKGRMVGRFQLLSKPSRFVAQSPEMSLPNSVSYPRIAWRDVSRPTQARRMKAALVPAEWVTGNSVNVAHFAAGHTKLLRALLAVINSFAFEVQVRALTATAHVSLGTVRQAAVPDLNEPVFLRKINSLVKKRITGDQNTEPVLEALVAKAYGFNTADFDLLLTGFPKLDPDYRAVLRDSFSKT